MTKLYTMLACCLCVAVAACKKCETLYHQSYDVTYFQRKDSFVAVAYFHSNVQTGHRVLLSPDDAIFFNDRPADHVVDHTYTWEGEGKTDVRFVLSKRKRRLITSEAGSRFADLHFVCPDTISKHGQTIRVAGSEGRLVYIYIIDSGQNVVRLELLNGNVCITPEMLVNCLEGPAIIRIVETIPGKVMRDDDMSGTFNYHLQYDYSVYYTN